MLCQIQTIQYGPKWMQIYNCQSDYSRYTNLVFKRIFIEIIFFNFIDWFCLFLVFEMLTVFKYSALVCWRIIRIVHTSICEFWTKFMVNKKFVSYIRIKFDRTIDQQFALSYDQKCTKFSLFVKHMCISKQISDLSSNILHFHLLLHRCFIKWIFQPNWLFSYLFLAKKFITALICVCARAFLLHISLNQWADH